MISSNSTQDIFGLLTEHKQGFLDNFSVVTVTSFFLIAHEQVRHM